jgi:hypothetical protein
VYRFTYRGNNAWVDGSGWDVGKIIGSGHNTVTFGAYIFPDAPKTSTTPIPDQWRLVEVGEEIGPYGKVSLPGTTYYEHSINGPTYKVRVCDSTMGHFYIKPLGVSYEWAKCAMDEGKKVCCSLHTPHCKYHYKSGDKYVSYFGQEVSPLSAYARATDWHEDVGPVAEVKDPRLGDAPEGYRWATANDAGKPFIAVCANGDTDHMRNLSADHYWFTERTDETTRPAVKLQSELELAEADYKAKQDAVRDAHKRLVELRGK